MENDVDFGTHYTLAEDRQTPVRCNLREWGRMLEDYQRRLVACEVMITPEGEEITVSTIFIGIDLSLGFGPAPLLWETMLFGDIDIGDQTDTWRHVSHADALTVHNEVARRVREALAQRQTSLPETREPASEIDTSDILTFFENARYRTLTSPPPADEATKEGTALYSEVPEGKKRKINLDDA